MIKNKLLWLFVVIIAIITLNSFANNCLNDFNKRVVNLERIRYNAQKNMAVSGAEAYKQFFVDMGGTVLSMLKIDPYGTVVGVGYAVGGALGRVQGFWVKARIIDAKFNRGLVAAVDDYHACVGVTPVPIDAPPSNGNASGAVSKP